MNKAHICGCDRCRDELPFDLPDDMIAAVRQGRLVVFAGAGVSTETPMVFPMSLYLQIKCELGIHPQVDISFSKLMSEYCKLPNGRRKLLQRIHDRLGYVKSFPELRRSASRFHRQLSTIPQVKKIFTTNWDDLFESECGAIPIVEPKDLVLWDTPDRKVVKIHGSVPNYGSIVATEEDYQECYARLRDGAIGAQLKATLSTEMVVFVGYSFGDEDFNTVYQFLQQELGGMLPHSYIITLNERAVERFRGTGTTPIITDATYFVSVLKKRLIEAGLMLDDSIFDYVDCQQARVVQEHVKLEETFNYKQHPEVLYASSYQDGLIHALERIAALKNTGYYSDRSNTIAAMRSYEEVRKEKLHQGKYHDVAYIDGYTNGLAWLLLETSVKAHLPLYYVFGSKQEMRTIDEYAAVAEHAYSLHKSAYCFAKKIAGTTPEGAECHHTPFLC